MLTSPTLSRFTSPIAARGLVQRGSAQHPSVQVDQRTSSRDMPIQLAIAPLGYDFKMTSQPEGGAGIGTTAQMESVEKHRVDEKRTENPDLTEGRKRSCRNDGENAFKSGEMKYRKVAYQFVVNRSNKWLGDG